MIDGESVRCGKVLASRDSLSEVGERYPVVAIERDKVVEVRLRRGSTAERPFFQFLFGLAMIGVGLYALARILSGVGGVASAGGVAMAIFGVMILFQVVRPGHYLDVRTRNDRRKLCFGAGVQARELAEFIQRARQELDIEIASELAPPDEPGYR